MKKPLIHNSFLLALFLTGFFIRLAGISHNGMHNYETYREWGRSMNNLGMADAFNGGYGPISYHIMGWSDSLSKYFPVHWWIPFKGANLLFESLILIFLLILLPKKKTAILLLFWLMPWFIIIGSWTGFWDAIFILPLLISLVILDNEKIVMKRYLFGGFLFGITFCTKPQIMAPLSIIGLYFLIKYLIKFHFKEIILFFTGFLFIPFIYNFYFFLNAKSAFYLFQVYFGFADYMPYLVNSQINIWYFITRIIMFFQHISGPVYSLKTTIFPYNYMEKGAYLIYLILIFIYVINTVRSKSIKSIYLRLSAFSLVLMPQILTRSHANHFYPATVLLIPIIIINRDKILLISWLLSTVIQTNNILFNYGIGRNIYNPIPVFGEPYLTVSGLIQFILTLIIISRLFKQSK